MRIIPAAAACFIFVLFLTAAIVVPFLIKTDSSDNTNTTKQSEDAPLPQTGGWNTVDGRLLSCSLEDEEVTVPDSVTSIAANAFRSCAVKRVNITPGISEIESGALDGLISVHLTADSVYYFEYNSVLISVGTGKLAFVGAEAMASTFDGTKEIKSSAYEGTQYTVVVIPESVESIGNRAFYKCDKLCMVVMGDYVKKIDYQAFSACSSLEYLRLSSALEVIEDSALRIPKKNS